MDLNKFSIGSDKKQFKKASLTVVSGEKINGFFVKGQIPLDWLKLAAALPGKSLNVAMACWFLKGLNKSDSFELEGKTLDFLNVKRHAGYRALKALEQARLVLVEQKPGRRPRVTIINYGKDQ